MRPVTGVGRDLGNDSLRRPNTLFVALQMETLQGKTNSWDGIVNWPAMLNRSGPSGLQDLLQIEGKLAPMLIAQRSSRSF